MEVVVAYLEALHKKEHGRTEKKLEMLLVQCVWQTDLGMTKSDTLPLGLS
jgi:hypothetical protein